MHVNNDDDCGTLWKEIEFFFGDIDVCENCDHDDDDDDVHDLPKLWIIGVQYFSHYRHCWKALVTSRGKVTTLPKTQKTQMCTLRPTRTRCWCGSRTRQRTGSSTTRSSRPTRSLRRPRRQPSRQPPQSWKHHPCPQRNPSLNFPLFLVREQFCDDILVQFCLNYISFNLADCFKKSPSS